jgi:hypothetical protein
VITYEPKTARNLAPQDSLWLKVRNLENITLRAAFLRGPYILYVDVRTEDYHHSKATFVTADQPRFEPNLLPGQSFNVELSMHTIKEKYVWVVDVMSQIIFSPTTDITFELIIGADKSSTDVKIEKLGTFNDQLSVNRKGTLDLWNLPLPQPNKPIHLVILTHGLHSNTGADMFYIKDQLDSMAAHTGENLIVRGYHHNVCKTEKGVKYLGIQLAKYVVQQLKDDQITKISFIGHSLGGLIQVFAMTYIEINCPWIFKKAQPVNFIGLASPFLGIVTDNPAYVKAALIFGVVGKTGQDLGLESINGEDPLLKKLSLEESTHRVLKKFKNRTLYANAINDGIVPLYTAALLYLDWKGLSKISGDDATNVTQDDNKAGKIPDAIDEKINKDEDFFTKTTKTLTNPFHKAISLWAPNIQSGDQDQSDESFSNSFPKTSMIESATSVLIPPLPSNRYLIDPNSRDDVIIHDKVYTSSDIPDDSLTLKKKPTFMDKINYDPLSKFKLLEEDIAKNWHRDLEWRKVLVKLKPDAHNNIFVRRRFSNAYGWPVIDHLIKEHFMNYEDDNTAIEEPVTTAKEVDADLGDDYKLSTDYDWIVKENLQDSMFDMGPTGLISNFNEILDNFQNWNPSSDIKVDGNNETKAKINDEAIEDELDVTTNYSEGYII